MTTKSIISTRSTDNLGLKMLLGKFSFSINKKLKLIEITLNSDPNFISLLDHNLNIVSFFSLNQKNKFLKKIISVREDLGYDDINIEDYTFQKSICENYLLRIPDEKLFRSKIYNNPKNSEINRILIYLFQTFKNNLKVVNDIIKLIFLEYYEIQRLDYNTYSDNSLFFGSFS